MKIEVSYRHFARALDDVREYFANGRQGRDYSERCVIAHAIREVIGEDCRVSVHFKTICAEEKKFVTSEECKKIIHFFDELETAVRQGYDTPPRIEHLPITLELEELP